MAVYNPPPYRPGKYLAPAARRIPLPTTSKRRAYFPPPDYRGLERGTRGVTLLVCSRIKRVRVSYYEYTGRIGVGWYSVGEYPSALADARSFLRTGEIA